MTRKIEVINYSEFATLADCESKWVYAYQLQREETGEKAGLHLGTLCHVWWGRWIAGLGATLPTSWTDDINTGGKPGEMRTLSLSDFDPALVERARWLAARYESLYGSQPPESWNVISTEGWLQGRFKIGSRIVRLVGRTDALIRVNGQLWLVEVKSFGRKGRLATIGVEPQPTIYLDLIEQNYGERPVGILYVGIYTHQWVPTKPTQKALIEEQLALAHSPLNAMTGKERTEWARAQVEAHPGVERDPSESFQLEWIDRTPQAVAVGQVFLGAAIKRRDRIKSIDDAIPNVGNHCDWCGFKGDCWARLTGVPQDTMVVEIMDDGDVPV